MPRTSPKRRLERSPLVLALTEIRFAPILAMSSHIPNIQDRLRREGFPAFEESNVQQVEMVFGGDAIWKTNARWLFSSTDGLNVIVLTTGGVSIQTRAYEDFEQFLNLVKTAIRALKELVAPSFAARIGLRYVDAVPQVGNDMSGFFSEPVLTFSAEDLGVQSLMSNQYIVGKTDVGSLQIRLTQVEDSPLLPPDLMSPELAELANPLPGVHAILDIDSSDESRSNFTWEAVEARLWGVHEYSSAAFWKAVTEKARQTWGELELGT